jgi:clan AA aspartic protease (TIGR02281 family)
MTRGWQLLTIAALSALCTGAGWVQLNEAGKAAYSRGELVEAERLFREAIAAAPDEPMPHYHRGVALTRLRRFEEAAAAYQRALQLDPPSSIATAARAGLRTVEPMTRRPPPDEGLLPPARGQARPPRAALPDDSVRLRRSWGNWFVDVVINDMQRATFLVDTGATACAITPALAEALGIQRDPDRPPVLVHGVAGSTYAHVVIIPSIRVGDVESQNVRAIIMPLGDGMHGILGNTFLARYTTTIDPGQGVLTLKPR